MINNQYNNNMSTEIQKKADIKSLMANESVKAKFAEILGKNGNAFMSSVVTIATTTQLADCEPKSILSCAIMAASLNLQVSPSLGYAAIIPYNSKTGKVAQFQIMSKGLIQLAQRSGLFETMNVTEVFEGEISKNDRLTGQIELSGEKKSEKIVGYLAYFKLLNGFDKCLYMTIEEINAHGKKFSKTFGSQYGAWSTNFEGMAKKTVLKLLLNRYAPLSVEMQHAVSADQATIKAEGDGLELSDFQYVDNEPANGEISDEAKNLQNPLK